MVALPSGEGSPCSRTVELSKPNRDGECSGVQVPERNTIRLDSHAGLVLVGRYFERRVSELLGPGVELGSVEKFTVVTTTRGVDCGVTGGFVEVPVADEIVVAGDGRPDVGVGLGVLGYGGAVVGVQPEHETIEGVLGEVRGGAVADRAVSDEHHVALQFGGENGAVGGEIAHRLVADHGSDRGGGGEGLGYVGPHAGSGGGVEGHEAIVVLLSRFEVGQGDGKLAFLVARLEGARPRACGGAAVGLAIVYVDQYGCSAVVGYLAVCDGICGGHVGGILCLDHWVGRLHREFENKLGGIAGNRRTQGGAVGIGKHEGDFGHAGTQGRTRDFTGCRIHGKSARQVECGESVGAARGLHVVGVGLLGGSGVLLVARDDRRTGHGGVGNEGGVLFLVVVSCLHPVGGASRIGYAGLVERRLHGGTDSEGGVSRVHAGRVGGESGCAVEGAVQVELCLAEPLVYGCRRMHPSIYVQGSRCRFGDGYSTVQGMIENELVAAYAESDVSFTKQG